MIPSLTPKRRSTDKDESCRGCGLFLLITILLVWLFGAVLHHLLSGA